MNAALMILPVVWAVEAPFEARVEYQAAPKATHKTTYKAVVPEMAYYRRYTEALLRRYVKMSMEAGRAPSLLGREMFRGKVTSYRVHSFEDVVIFVHDVERCLARLDPEDRFYIDRIAMQEYTHDETVERAELPGMNRRTMLRRYGSALDSLTRILLGKGMLEPQMERQLACQEVENSFFFVTV